MSNLPHINVSINNTIHAFAEDGELVYKYSPFQNLKIEAESGKIDLGPLRLKASEANIGINNPIEIDSELSYDQSVNLLINDHKNPLKVVNSRFYLTSANSYKIADRKGNLDTNIYTKENFPTETGLIKTVRSVVTLDYLGIFDGGSMPVGSYNFYFKLADIDGNESDFISESGKIVCHIGAINHPKSIRGGLLDENSDKLIKFRLNNLDLAYNFINIYYTRSSGDDKSETLQSYKINDKFKIDGTSTEISITGYEEHEQIDISEINIQYSNFTASETTENCQNITFVGNVTKNYDLFRTLEKLSLFITPRLATTSERKDIGYLNQKYEENYSPNDGYEYYNTKNIYYKLGYWDEEIYRFGIVYIMNDYTLSPVFNIRGIQELNEFTEFIEYSINKEITYGEDFILTERNNVSNFENAKGIFKIKSTVNTFNGNSPIKPIGIKFNFYEYIEDEVNKGVLSGDPTKGILGLKDLTKGFFIVRQKRIPTILTQGLSIATAEKSFTPIINGTFTNDESTSIKYFSESFLTTKSNKPILGRGLFEVTDIRKNALLCPEANNRPYIYNNLFNSSEFVLKQSKYITAGRFIDESQTEDRIIFNLGNLVNSGQNNNEYINSNLLFVEPGIELIHNNEIKFSSRAGLPEVSWKHLDPVLGDIEALRDTENETYNDNKWSLGVTKVRGDFNGYVGSSYDNLNFGQYYNIFQKNYNFEARWREYFRVRANDSSPFMPVSDRIPWSSITDNSTETIYRGDCYINTYTHRMLWNFTDPELPTNNQIIDPWTWYKNFRVKTTTMTVYEATNQADIIMDNTNTMLSDGTNDLSYKKILDLFTYKSVDINVDPETADSGTISTYSITLPDSKRFEKYAETNGTYGATKINRADVNAVGLGHWVTFKICSNINLSFRDLDFSNPAEESIHKMKRGFYPLQSAKPTNKLPESTVINSGISKTLGSKLYFEIPDVPFIKTSFTTRIYYSDVLQESSFKNGNRVFKSQNYQDYSNEYGALVKLVEWYGTLIAVMEHGVLMIPVNERAMMANASGENVYINTENVLPKNPRVLSNTFGSKWQESVVRTQRYIYGLDTIGKKVWRTNGESFEIISDLKIQKFLNDHVNLKIGDRDKTVGESVIKTHYNAFKHDILFVFIYGDEKWHLCWNELQEKWVTQYTWFPEFSENINNIFYTFANEKNHIGVGNILYKHGFAGTNEESGDIKPTYWYDQQYPFEYEFVVIGVPGVQKIFNNLKIISNWAEPNSFEFEIVGEGFNWNNKKSTIYSLRPEEDLGSVASNLAELETNYQTYLSANTDIHKLPFIWARDTDTFDPYWPIVANPATVKDITIREHNKTKEKLILVYQKGLDIWTQGRLRGNMQYVEDSWDVQIQPVYFKNAYLSSGSLTFTKTEEMRIRDKYVKVRVKYDGTKYAIVNAVRTLFTISYA